MRDPYKNSRFNYDTKNEIEFQGLNQIKARDLNFPGFIK